MLEKTYDKACTGCIHLGWIGGYIGCCNYIFHKDERRPCPPGKGCTVKEKKKKGRAKKDD